MSRITIDEVTSAVAVAAVFGYRAACQALAAATVQAVDDAREEAYAAGYEDGEDAAIAAGEELNEAEDGDALCEC